MKKDDPDSAGNWGLAAHFMLMWAITFYLDGNEQAGDSHFAVAYTNVREAARRANLELGPE